MVLTKMMFGLLEDEHTTPRTFYIVAPTTPTTGS